MALHQLRALKPWHRRLPQDGASYNPAMTVIQQIVCMSALAAAAGFSCAVQAQPATADASSAAASMAVEPTEGEVRKLDKGNRMITLKHGEIRNLGMPPMAMVFEVKDRALLDRLKVGDKVRFKASYQGGKYIVTDIHPAR